MEALVGGGGGCTLRDGRALHETAVGLVSVRGGLSCLVCPNTEIEGSINALLRLL